MDEKNCVLETLQVEIKQLKKENSDNDISIENQKVEVYDLKLANKKASEASNKLNKVLSDLKVNFKKEKNAILKQNKAEIKYWRKELGEETKVRIKLEEKLNEHPLKIPADDILGLQHKLNPTVPLPQSPPSASEETLCSICASPIPNYVPKYFHGEKFNPACNKCDDTSWMSDNSTSDETFLEADPTDITAELSVKSDLEERDTCKACNVDVESVFSNTNFVDNHTESKESTGAVNRVQYFWNGDLYGNNRLAIDYINMSQNSHHDCSECN